MSSSSAFKPARARQRGIALITALLVVSLAAIAAVSMLSAQNIAIHRTGNIIATEQAWWYAVGMEQWATTLLSRDRERGVVDSLNESWARGVDYLPIKYGFLNGRLIDLHSRFNLNRLAGGQPDEATRQLVRLLENIPDFDPVQAPALAQAIRDWVDPDIDPGIPDGAEDDYYLGLTPAYRTPNAPMVSPSELLSVRGVTPEIYRALRPHIATLPNPNSAINVNTATLPVLMSLAPGLERQQIMDLAETRLEQPFGSTQAFLAQPAFAGRALDGTGLSVSSQFFLARGEVHVGDARVILYSLLFRNQQGNTVVVEHSKGVF